jgi:drug/metabolite transporter (DMT)-like permease
MSLAADVMIVFGAVLLTFGTDLVISSASEPATVGAPLGVLVSIIGATLLASGAVVNRRRRIQREASRARDSGDG